MNRLALVAILLFTFSFAVAAPFTLPNEPESYVSDYAKVLEPEYKTKLEALCKSIDGQLNGLQIAVVTVPTLNDQPVEDVAVDIFSKWKIGKKGKDNGLLLLIAPAERKVKIEVGYGLEPILPDGLVGEFLDRGFVHSFRVTNSYGVSAINTVTMLVKRVAKMEGVKLEGIALESGNRKPNQRKFNWWYLLFMLLFIFRGRGIFPMFPGGGFGGGGGGGWGSFGGGGFGGFGGGGSGGGGASRSF